MKKTTLILLILSSVIALNCSSSKNSSFKHTKEAIRKVTVSELTKAESVRPYQNQKVIFTAKFGQISAGFNRPGIEQYKITHFLVSLVSEDGKAKLPYVLVPTYSKILPGLQSADLIQVEAEPYIASTGDEDDYDYVVVSEMTKI